MPIVAGILFFTLAASPLINQFLPAPSSGNSEWVEFYASESADLSGYYFDDDSSFDSDSGNSAKIALSGLLPAASTCYWELSTYLNNNGDSPTLFKTDGIAQDTYTYTVTQTDKAYRRLPDGEDWQVNVIATRSAAKCLDLVPAPVATSAATQTPVTQTPPAPSPAIEWSLPAQANLGEAFKVSVSFKNFEANKEYYLKLRGVRTKSGAAFLADNQAWVEFPVAAADSSGNWSGEVWGLVAEDKDPGTYEIRVRARRKDTDAYYESDAKGIKLVKVLIPVVATKSAVLGTESARPKKTASKAAAPVETVKVDSSTDDMPRALIALGVIFLAGSAVSYIINSKWRSATGST